RMRRARPARHRRAHPGRGRGRHAGARADAADRVGPPMTDRDAPYHAHIYYAAEERAAAAALRDAFLRLAGAGDEPPVLFVGRMMDGGVGPHPIPQYEIHFRAGALAGVVA